MDSQSQVPMCKRLDVSSTVAFDSFDVLQQLRLQLVLLASSEGGLQNLLASQTGS